MKLFLNIALAICLCGVLGGCLAVVAGAGTAGVREITDKVTTYKGDANSLEQACRKAVADLGGSIKEVEREEEKGGNITLRGRTYDDEHLTIDIEPTSPSSAEIEVRVGRIGSKKRAEEIHVAIQKYAKTVM
ncbi:MAG: DUF3568 family protein [Planctomycetes bacterium]|nr:DUF3568 family protein [Planctomycetota bacterium]